MKIIKATRVYKAELPAADLLRKHLEELTFSDISEHEYSRSGFVPAPGSPDGDLVTALSGGYALGMRYDEKIVPAASVKAATAKRAEEIHAAQGYAVGRKQLRELRDEVFHEMLKVALHRTTVVPIFYDPASHLLLVCTTSEKLADLAMRNLIKVVGSIKTTTIHIAELKGGLTARLRDQVFTAENKFGAFTLGGSFWLKLDKEKVTIESSVSEEDSGPLREALESSLQVEALRLSLGPVAFKLSSDFVFRSVSFEAPEEEESFETMADAWMHEAAVQLKLMVDAIEQLCELVGYTPPEEDDFND